MEQYILVVTGLGNIVLRLQAIYWIVADFLPAKPLGTYPE